MSDGARCPGCDASDARAVFTSWNGYPILRCNACDLVFTDDRAAPPPSALYPAFEQSRTTAAQAVRAGFSVFMEQRAAFVRRVCASAAPRLLDFGCGSGAFARYMSQRSFEVVGLEPFSLGAPTHERGLTLLRKPLADAEPELGSFDVITLWHVLEHVRRPAELLAGLARHLTPDGVFVLSVPNFASMQSALFGPAWFHLDPPRHLCHFEPKTLAATLDRAGLETFDRAPFLPEYGVSGWVQSALNGVLPRKNFFFELVKDRGALRDVPRPSLAAHAALSVLGAIPVAAATLPLEALASRSDRGAALTVAARRRSG